MVRSLLTRLQRIILALMLVLVLGPVGGVAIAAPPSAEELDDLEQRIEALVEGQVGESTPGAMVAVVDPEGPLLTEAWGQADPLAQTPLTTGSRTPVASVSKVVSSLTALRLHHEGALDLDADIRSALPVQDCRDDLERGPVTGWHLLTHHSGIVEPLLLHPDPQATAETGPLLPKFEAHPPVLGRPSGAGLHYSPIQGYDLVGAMIERATGTGFEQAAIEWVLDPAGAQQADFGGPGTEEGDVQLSTRDGEGWGPTSWSGMPNSPAASLTWSTEDAGSLLHTLLSGDGLPAEVVTEATTPSVRPAHGGGGHTGVFFESWRADVPVLEHAGANGLAWLALIPSADLGVFAAVTTEDPAAAELTGAILDEVAQWALDTGRTEPDPMPAEGMAAITPSWAAETAPVAPVGTFHEQVFAERGPELLLRTVTGQTTVRAEGADLLWRERRLQPTSTEGRWCDEQSCLAGVRTEDGTVLLLRSDGAMPQQTLVPAPWWADLRFVGSAVAGALLLMLCALGGTVRAWWRRRHDREVPAAVSRGVALAWSLVTVALIGGTVMLPLLSLTGDTSAYLASEGGAVWALRLGTAAQLALGGVWLVMLSRRWSVLSGVRRVLVLPVLLAGLAMSTVLVTWALPSV